MALRKLNYNAVNESLAAIQTLESQDNVCYLSDNCSVRSAGLAMLIVDVGLRALDQGRSKLPYHSFGMVTSK